MHRWLKQEKNQSFLQGIETGVRYVEDQGVITGILGFAEYV
jgi:hypothetical protein